MYGKRTEIALAAMSRLAEAWDGGSTRLSAADIATRRGLGRAAVARILTALARSGLVSGAPGPGGGYALARDPAEISFYEVYRLFEGEREPLEVVPFVGLSSTAPIGPRVAALRSAMDELLHRTTFAVFRSDDGAAEQARTIHPRPLGATRESYRAPLSRRRRRD